MHRISVSILILVIELQLDEVSHSNLVDVVDDKLVVLKTGVGLGVFSRAARHYGSVFQIVVAFLVRNRSPLAPRAVFS